MCIRDRDLGYVDRSTKENLFLYEVDFLVKKKKLGQIIDRCIQVHGTSVTAEKMCIRDRLETYRKLRPGEPPTVESASSHINGLFFDPRRYDQMCIRDSNFVYDVTVYDDKIKITLYDGSEYMRELIERKHRNKGGENTERCV